MEVITVQKAWLKRLLEVAERFEKDPTEANKASLLGYISSARYIIGEVDNK